MRRRTGAAPLRDRRGASLDPCAPRCGRAALHRGDLLLCHRSPTRKWFPDVWDLPGGHIEPGEVGPLAVSRELSEELGICAAAPERKADWQLRSPDLELDVWILDDWTGTPTNCAADEHDLLGWFTPPEAVELRLADASYLELFRLLPAVPDGKSPLGCDVGAATSCRFDRVAGHGGYHRVAVRLNLPPLAVLGTLAYDQRNEHAAPCHTSTEPPPVPTPGGVRPSRPVAGASLLVAVLAAGALVASILHCAD